MARERQLAYFQVPSKIEAYRLAAIRGRIPSDLPENEGLVAAWPDRGSSGRGPREGGWIILQGAWSLPKGKPVVSRIVVRTTQNMRNTVGDCRIGTKDEGNTPGKPDLADSESETRGDLVAT